MISCLLWALIFHLLYPGTSKSTKIIHGQNNPQFDEVRRQVGKRGGGSLRYDIVGIGIGVFQKFRIIFECDPSTATSVKIIGASFCAEVLRSSMEISTVVGLNSSFWWEYGIIAGFSLSSCTKMYSQGSHITNYASEAPRLKISLSPRKESSLGSIWLLF